jgi:hypothetical protein
MARCLVKYAIRHLGTVLSSDKSCVVSLHYTEQVLFAVVPIVFVTLLLI